MRKQFLMKQKLLLSIIVLVFISSTLSQNIKTNISNKKQTITKKENINSNLKDIIDFSVFYFTNKFKKSNSMFVISEDNIPQFSNAVCKHFEKYQKLKLHIDLQYSISGFNPQKTIKLDTINTIKLKFSKPLYYQIIFSKGEIGEKNGNIYIADSSLISIDSVNYIYKGKNWCKYKSK